MKKYRRYVSSANKLTNSITERISQKFDENEILIRALVGNHKGSPMVDVFLNIVANPFVEIEDPEREEGSHTIFYNKKNVGWIDFQRGMGWIDDRAYDKMEKLPAEILRPMADQFREGLAEEAGARGLLGPRAQEEALERRADRERMMENLDNFDEDDEDLYLEDGIDDDSFGDSFWDD